jgi:hypothetical protein
MTSRVLMGAAVVVAGGGGARTTGAQQPATAVRIAVGFGVDTVSSPNQEIFRLYQRYLRFSSVPPVWGRVTAMRSRTSSSAR